MLKKLAATALLATLAATAQARDDRLQFPVSEALATPEAQAKIDSQIKLVFGKTPAGAKALGTYTSNKKTNFFNKSDKDGCEWVFLSAVLALQARAKQEGGNAVVNIVSVYRNNELSSETEYQCGAGSVMGGVALRGTVAKLP